MAKKKVEPVVIHNNCGNCRFFQPLEDDIGDCLRYPPTVCGVGINDVTIQALPETEAQFFCGEHGREIN